MFEHGLWFYLKTLTLCPWIFYSRIIFIVFDVIITLKNYLYLSWWHYCWSWRYFTLLFLTECFLIARLAAFRGCNFSDKFKSSIAEKPLYWWFMSLVDTEILNTFLAIFVMFKLSLTLIKLILTFCWHSWPRSKFRSRGNFERTLWTVLIFYLHDIVILLIISQTNFNWLSHTA